MEFPIGINVGDVISDGGDIFGDGVNVAARLENIADRGGICISRQVLDQVEAKLDLNFRELGRQNLKNIAKPVEVYAIQLDGAVSPGSRFLAAADLKQEIRYCKAPDGVRLAYATAGSGPPLLRSAHWLGHLEYDWELPILQHFLLRLAKDHTLVRYDARGNGLSDWDVHEIALDAWVSDMETVADAAGLDRSKSWLKRAIRVRLTNPYAANSSSSAFASFRSRVSNPSAQPVSASKRPRGAPRRRRARLPPRSKFRHRTRLHVFDKPFAINSD